MGTRAISTALALSLCVVACNQADVRSPGSADSQTRPACGLEAARLGEFVRVPAGSFAAGARPELPEEGPPLRVHVSAFDLQRHEVTNDQFAAFVAATSHVTDAERSTQGGRDDAGSGVFSRGSGAGKGAGAWALVNGATWRTPEGPGSDIRGKGAWPVVHVSYRDAIAYAQWAKARLPSEIEWEYAASLGLPDQNDSRSGAFDPQGKPRANTWQGLFPLLDEGKDGFLGPSPVGCFPADRIGAYDMIGNVWEWTALQEDNKPATTGATSPQALIKGGSHLCTDTFCGRFRPEARQLQDIDFSTNHVGFRIVRDAPALP
jgi:formylglycine-generating enzyme